MTDAPSDDDLTTQERELLAALLYGSTEEKALALRALGVIPAEELLDEFGKLTDEQKAVVIDRAIFLRYGPTGMNDAEAIVAAMQEWHDGKLKLP
ncbi:MAG TPA: hypothetical protein VLE72_02380 [Candidatus Saccharimonadales bacterium]|nr:hypothetical protein [Candidatus Saccharimonadales bacterium]